MVILDKNNENFEYSEEYFQHLIDTKSGFEADDIKMFIEGFAQENIFGELGRWTRPVTTICKFKEKYYAAYWEMGLTEYQEDEYWDTQVHEVKPVEKVITVTEWEEV